MSQPPAHDFRIVIFSVLEDGRLHISMNDEYVINPYDELETICDQQPDEYWVLADLLSQSGYNKAGFEGVTDLKAFGFEGQSPVIIFREQEKMWQHVGETDFAAQLLNDGETYFVPVNLPTEKQKQGPSILVLEVELETPAFSDHDEYQNFYTETYTDDKEGYAAAQAAMEALATAAKSHDEEPYESEEEILENNETEQTDIPKSVILYRKTAIGGQFTNREYVQHVDLNLYIIQ